MSKNEIALQLTLKSIERMATPTSSEAGGKASTYNEAFSHQVADFYNYIYSHLED